MKITFRNPFARRVSTRYFRAEAIVRKRRKGYMENRHIWFDAPTADLAAQGLRKLMRQENCRMHRAKGVKEYTTYFYIPMWSLAFWWPPLINAYMLKKGYASAARD